MIELDITFALCDADVPKQMLPLHQFSSSSRARTLLYLAQIGQNATKCGVCLCAPVPESVSASYDLLTDASVALRDVDADIVANDPGRRFAASNIGEDSGRSCDPVMTSAKKTGYNIVPESVLACLNAGVS